MPLEIAQLGQPVLRATAAPLPLDEIADPQFQQFLDEMIATMKEAGGVGLAAPQVFVSRRVFVASIADKTADDEAADDEAPIGVFINPELSEFADESESAWEGCLSFLELLVLVPRRRGLRLSYLDRTGAPREMRLTGYKARVVQHEYDHLDGVLTIDRAISTRDIVKADQIDAWTSQKDESGDAPVDF